MLRRSPGHLYSVRELRPPGPRRAGLLAGRGSAPRLGQRGAAAAGRGRELPRLARGDRAGEAFVHFEIYIFTDDPVGERFAAALAAKAREGVPVRVVYDWMGGLGQDLARVLAAAAARAASRCAATTLRGSKSRWAGSEPRPPQVHRRGRPSRVRHRPLRRRGLGGRSGAGARRLARHRASRFADRRWPTWLGPSPTPGRPAGRLCRPDEPAPPSPATGRGQVALRVVATTSGTAGLFRLDPWSRPSPARPSG